MKTRKTFCSVNLDVTPVDKVIEDLERFRAEAQIAGYHNLVLEVDKDRKGWIIGDKV